MKTFIKILRFSKYMYPEIGPRACNFLQALLQMEERCWSELSSESIIIPSKVSVVLVVSETSSIDTLIGVLVLRSKWLLPGLALRWLYSNQWKSLLAVICSSLMTNWVSVPQEYGVVPYHYQYHFLHIRRINH